MAFGSSSSGMRMDLSQKQVAGVIARIYSAQRATVDAVQVATRGAGEFCREYTSLLAPKDTGFMAGHVRTVYSPDGLSFETGWLANDFAQAGRSFYPPFQEFGTRFMPAQPSLYPAYKATQRYYLDELRTMIRAAIAKQASRGASVA